MEIGLDAGILRCHLLLKVANSEQGRKGAGSLKMEVGWILGNCSICAR